MRVVDIKIVKITKVSDVHTYKDAHTCKDVLEKIYKMEKYKTKNHE